jgi:hypothetical protein
MNRIQHIRRVAGVLAGLACALLGFAATGPAAFAGIPVPGPGGAAGDPPPVFPAPIHTVTVVTGGMPQLRCSSTGRGARTGRRSGRRSEPCGPPSGAASGPSLASGSGPPQPTSGPATSCWIH